MVHIANYRTLKGDDLIPYQVKLGQIDNMRVDGKFMVGDAVPPGQAVLHYLLHKVLYSNVVLQIYLQATICL